MQTDSGYSLVRLRNGTCSVHSLADAETFHPGIGPAAEAEALYVRQLRLPQRAAEAGGEFVIWDVGLGAAANALTAVRIIRDDQAMRWSSRFSVPPDKLKLELQPPAPKILRLVSFDLTTDAAAFALAHCRDLGYLAGFEAALAELIEKRQTRFSSAGLTVEWSLELDDFPTLISRRHAGADGRLSKLEMGPHAILFDPHSPGKNPTMWTPPLFAGLFRRLDPQRPCALATFTRSTLARTALLLGGFFVGVGHPSGLKEETTVAANRMDLLDEPLDRQWLERAKRSHSAEPLAGPVYQRLPLSPETWQALQRHPQFA